MHGGYANFYSRPCGRGDEADVCGRNAVIISTHAPAGGATRRVAIEYRQWGHFYSRPCGRGDGSTTPEALDPYNFYSRPCGRGDRLHLRPERRRRTYFYSRPCGRGDVCQVSAASWPESFLLTPLREGRLSPP